MQHLSNIVPAAAAFTSPRYPVVKLALEGKEQGPFRRMSLEQEHEDIVSDLQCRAIEMWTNNEKPDTKINKNAQSSVDYSLYKVDLMYKDKDGEDCIILSGQDFFYAVLEYRGSSSFKVIAIVKKKQNQSSSTATENEVGNTKDHIGSIVNMRQTNTVAESREDVGVTAKVGHDSSRAESRDGISSSNAEQSDLSTLTEPTPRLVSSASSASRRKSMFGFLSGKRAPMHSDSAASVKTGSSAASLTVTSVIKKRLGSKLLFRKSLASKSLPSPTASTKSSRQEGTNNTVAITCSTVTPTKKESEQNKVNRTTNPDPQKDSWYKRTSSLASCLKNELRGQTTFGKRSSSTATTDSHQVRIFNDDTGIGASYSQSECSDIIIDFTYNNTKDFGTPFSSDSVSFAESCHSSDSRNSNVSGDVVQENMLASLRKAPRKALPDNNWNTSALLGFTL